MRPPCLEVSTERIVGDSDKKFLQKKIKKLDESEVKQLKNFSTRVNLIKRLAQKS